MNHQIFVYLNDPHPQLIIGSITFKLTKLYEINSIILDVGFSMSEPELLWLFLQVSSHFEGYTKRSIGVFLLCNKKKM